MIDERALCAGRDAWRDGRLGGEEAARFSDHIDRCVECRTWAGRIDRVARALQMEATPAVAPALWRERSRPLVPGRSRRRVALSVAVVVGGCAGLALAWRWQTAPIEAGRAGAAPVAAVMVPPASQPTARVYAVGAATLALSPDAVIAASGAGDGSVSLLAGTVMASVRHLGPGERFAVVAGPVTVVVHGTRFGVSRDRAGVSVRVEEGLVEVDAGESPAIFLPAGSVARFDAKVRCSVDAFTEADRRLLAPLDALLPSRAGGPSPSPSLEVNGLVPRPTPMPGDSRPNNAAPTFDLPAAPRHRDDPAALPRAREIDCRALLERGDAPGAAACSERLLEASAPGEDSGSTWMLLGDARRISGELDAAADAYRTVARVAPGSPIAADALFEIGRMYTESPGSRAQAVAAWQDYLTAFPRGALRGEAQRALAEIEGPASQR